MATVYAGTSGLNPAHTNPQLYSSCVWDYVIGWICQTVPQAPQAPQATPPLYDPNPPNVDNSTNPMTSALVPLAATQSGLDCGCCGSNGVSGVPVGGAAMSVGNIAMPKQCTCTCGYTNREALLAMLLAFGAFLLLKK